MRETVERWRLGCGAVMLGVLVAAMLSRPSPACSQEMWAVEDAGGCDADWNN